MEASLGLNAIPLGVGGMNMTAVCLIGGFEGGRTLGGRVNQALSQSVQGHTRGSCVRWQPSND
jgi:hypothetical protein